MLVNILDGLLVTCTKCNQVVRARDHIPHLDTRKLLHDVVNLWMSVIKRMSQQFRMLENLQHATNYNNYNGNHLEDRDIDQLGMCIYNIQVD
jgi:hypothetical protein